MALIIGGTASQQMVVLSGRWHPLLLVLQAMVPPQWVSPYSLVGTWLLAMPAMMTPWGRRHLLARLPQLEMPCMVQLLCKCQPSSHLSMPLQHRLRSSQG